MLARYRVLDLSSRLGWLAGRLLADLGAEVVKVEPPGARVDGADWQACNVNKRLLRLDLQTPQGRAAFDELAAGVDVLIESAQPADALAPLIDPDRLRRLNPHLVHVSITPFGRAGPRADWLASDIELMAAGGAMSLAGEPDGKPMRVTVAQSQGWAGAQAAVGALTALVSRSANGAGQHVDVSAQAAIILALSHAPAFWDMGQGEPTRAGAFITGRSIRGVRFRAFWPCADGYLNFVLYGGPAGRRTNRQLVEWMHERGAEVGALSGVDWDRFDPKLATQEDVERLEQPIARFFLGLRKREFLEETSRREMLGYPVSTTEDIAHDPQLAARDFWHDLRIADGTSQRHCGSFAIVDGRRAPLRHAPGAEVDLHQLLREFRSEPVVAERVGEPGRPAGHASAIPQALAGVKVTEFGAYAAGPHIGKMLAAFGATVVHVESRQRPDGFRNEYPPFKDGRPGLNRGGCFAMFNDSKNAVTLDLKKPAGIDLARRLMDWSDIVIENMRPGVMARLGLGYETARESNPSLVMISSCNMGQTGPRADTPGFGSQLSALAGFCGLTGDPNGPPMLLYGPYIDFIASSLGAAAVLAALDRQRTTAQGAFIDVAQYETGLLFIAAALLDFHQSGSVAQRAGNSDPLAAPHDAYPCREGGWLALSCWSDQQFERLAGAIERPELAQGPRFASPAARRSRAAELDAIVAAWTSTRDADEAAALLQARRVNAYRVNTVSDMFRDPQLAFRRVWRRRRHQAIGELSCFFSAFDLSQTPGDVSSAAPCLGADNDFVFGELLGMDDAQLAALRTSGAFD